MFSLEYIGESEGEGEKEGLKDQRED